ncbi:uncharacterized protein LOC129410257 isoform X2 [Boleophthalmus pectinirostris]|nr:uncharacterized protein LOC129410257 isoform X2 [Boleophthalmus pectinirostris]
MRRYWLPDYEKKLIGELQRQQNSAQFCDTLLQTEGISIPTHSSVLAALSLHLSHRLSTSSPPPAVQKHTLQLHTLKPHILLKLIGLLYSGELEVSGVVEQRDVLAAAHLFGLPDLVEREKVEVRNDQNGCKDCKRVEIEKRDAQIQVSPRSFCVSIGTQTSTSNSENQETASLSYVHQSCGSVENVGINTSDNSTSTACTEHSKTYSEEESVLERSTSATLSLSCPSENMTLHLSPSEDSICSRLQEGETQPTQPETSAPCIFGSPELVEEEEEESEVWELKVPENKEKTNQETRKEGAGVVKKRQVCKKVATKSLEKMQEMMEATQISIKVKLRRKGTKEEMWEVVNLQETDAFSDSISLRTDNCKRPQGELTAGQPCPSTDQAPELITSSPKPGPLTRLASGESVSAPSGNPVALHPSRLVEETDEQIEKLLEDIMIGLNILPNINKRNDKSRVLDLNHEGPSQVQKDCACCEDNGDQHGNYSTETGDSGCIVDPPSKPCGPNSELSLNNSCTSAGRGDSPQNSPCTKASPCLFAANTECNPPENPNILEFLPISTENEDSLFSMADLQFLPCLSPLDSNNNSTNENKTPAYSSLPGRTWLMDSPRSLQFPLATIASTSSGCKEKGSNNETDALLTSKQKVSKKKDNNVTPAKRRCPNLGINKSYKDLKVKTDGNVNLSHCLVSLSSNNVLAKDRTSPTTASPSNGSEPQTMITRCLRSKTKTSETTLRKTPIRTRRKLQCSPSSPEMSSPNPEMSKNERKRGRPRKRIVNKEKSEQQIQNTSLNRTDEVPSRAKRPKQEEDIEEGPSEQVDSSFDAKTDDNRIVTAEKKPRMVSLKEFQELIKRKHLKTQRTKDKSEKEQSKHVENCERGDAVRADSIRETDVANTHSANTDVIEDSDEQPLSKLCSKQSANAQKTPPPVDNCTSSINELSNLSEISDQSEICIEVIPKEVTKLSEEMEADQRTMPQLFDDVVTGCQSENELTIDDSFQHTAAHFENDTSANNSSDLYESKHSDAKNSKETELSTRSSGGLQNDEEDVDILLHSPDRTSVTTEGQKSVEISHDEEEEEEEDSNDVDVTGSETDA